MRMKAAVLYEQGKEHPFTESNPLVVEDVDLESPGDDEVLIRTGAAGLCHSDLSMIRGVMERKVPMVPGHEAAGVVEEVGPAGPIGLGGVLDRWRPTGAGDRFCV